MSVGAVSDKIILRRAVPPSAPLIPLLANIPSAVLSSAVPPAILAAVPPTVSIASPSIETLVFVNVALFASWSENEAKFCSVGFRFKADIASVTISEADAKSIAPAPASLSV